MKLRYEKGLFKLECHISDSELPKKLHMVWDKSEQVWITPWPFKIKKLLPIIENPKDIEDSLKACEAFQNKTAELSSSLYVKEKAVAPKDLETYSYQDAGVAFATSRNCTLIADDMGIGKTIQAICSANILKPKKVLIVCPATAKRNWEREWNKWTTLKNTVAVGDISKDVFIINYDVLHKYDLREIKWDMIIIDEAHYCKNSSAKRTVQLFGGRLKNGVTWKMLRPLDAKYKLCLTGTPILNRPIEIFPVLKYLLPSGFHDKMQFAKRFCGAYLGTFGWDMSGATNGEELQKLLRSTIMLRRLKSDVLPELPNKFRQIIEIDPDTNAKKALQKEANIWDAIFDKEITDLDDESYQKLVKAMKGGGKLEFETMSTLRKELAVAKIPMIIQHLEDVMMSVKKVVCFCHHREVAEALHKHFKDKSVMLIGGTNEKAKDAAIQSFQNVNNIELFIGNITSAGVAITLTAASHMVFAEFCWTPGELTQAEDRCHRIGLKNNLLIQHLVFARTMEATMLKYIVRKQDYIDKALNSKVNSELAELLS